MLSFEIPFSNLLNPFEIRSTGRWNGENGRKGKKTKAMKERNWSFRNESLAAFHETSFHSKASLIRRRVTRRAVNAVGVRVVGNPAGGTNRLLNASSLVLSLREMEKEREKEVRLQKRIVAFVCKARSPRWAYTEHALGACNCRQIYNFARHLG